MKCYMGTEKDPQMGSYIGFYSRVSVSAYRNDMVSIRHASIVQTQTHILKIGYQHCTKNVECFFVPRTPKVTLRKTDHKTWMLKVRIVFGNIKYVKAYDL